MSRIIIGLAGEAGSGKGTVAKYLIEKYGAKSYRFSDLIRKILDILHLDQSRENLSQLSLSLRQGFGEDLFSRVLAQEVIKGESEIVIIDGVRRAEDIEHLEDMDGFKLVYVETSLEKRYERIIQRGENVGETNKTFEEFKKQHELETEAEISNIKTIADMLIENNGTPEELQQKIDKLLK